MTERTAGKIAVGTITLAVALVLWFFVWPGSVWGVATPVQFRVGWPMDSCYWVYIQDSVRIDSSSKRYDVTEWPDTTFDLALGHVHRIWLYYWAPGLDSANWEKIYDYYDYNNANCVGGGAYVASFVVYDSANDEAVQNAKVTIKQDSSLGATETWWMTNTNGVTEFALDNGDYSAGVSKPRFMSSFLDFSITSGSYSDTIFGYQVSTPAPPSLDYALVEGYVWGIDGKKLYGAKIRAHRVTPEGEYAIDTSNTSAIIAKDVAVVTVDTSGHFFMYLQRTYNTTRGTYTFVGESVGGAVLFTIPDVPMPASGGLDLGLVAGRRE